MKGLNDIKRKLDDIGKKLKEIDGKNEVPIDELLSDSFISNCSKFSSAEELLNAGGFQIESNEDIEAIPQEKLDEFIRGNTTYKNWEEMLQDAIGEWVKQKIGL